MKKISITLKSAVRKQFESVSEQITYLDAVEKAIKNLSAFFPQKLISQTIKSILIRPRGKSREISYLAQVIPNGSQEESFLWIKEQPTNLAGADYRKEGIVSLYDFSKEDIPLFLPHDFAHSIYSLIPKDIDSKFYSLYRSNLINILRYVKMGGDPYEVSNDLLTDYAFFTEDKLIDGATIIEEGFIAKIKGFNVCRMIQKEFIPAKVLDSVAILHKNKSEYFAEAISEYCINRDKLETKNKDLLGVVESTIKYFNE